MSFKTKIFQIKSRFYNYCLLGQFLFSYLDNLFNSLCSEPMFLFSELIKWNIRSVRGSLVLHFKKKVGGKLWLTNEN